MAKKKHKRTATEVRTQRIRGYLRRYGPLYARAIVPDYALHDWELGNYGAWYVADCDPNRLEEEVIQEYADAFVQENGQPDPCDGLSTFAEYLESLGYVILHTWHEGVVVITGLDVSDHSAA